ncbi:hypothetical protein JIG36_48875 [Actinoplanes sp. LDG1-06]|uniref:GNAT family N-acetyltransferase n=1 Tax=Paractinoplanes ovalisporus TaxID=2810368 RepID=A0ABS2AU80_9ACTN|nr:hypothetical protein [Actinoplanes ovalisporus]MBM2623437.1 hypothetical protein [Actinoplanes ovalisporus]
MRAIREIRLRTAGVFDTTITSNALAPLVHRNQLLWSLHPPASLRTNIAREYLRTLSAHVTVKTQVAELDGEVIGAAWWNSCTTPEHPEIELTIPGAEHNPRVAAALHAVLAERHPAQPHEHLLLVAARKGLRTLKVGQALFNDVRLSDAP